MIVDKLGNSFSRVAIAGRSAKVALFVDLWEYVKRPALGSEVDERYCSVSESIRLSLYSVSRVG